jgi:hypothetical protein
VPDDGQRLGWQPGLSQDLPPGQCRLPGRDELDSPGIKATAKKTFLKTEMEGEPC